MTLSQHYNKSIPLVRMHGFDRPIHHEPDATDRADALYAAAQELIPGSWPVSVGVLSSGKIGTLVTTGDEPVAIVFEV